MLGSVGICWDVRNVLGFVGILGRILGARGGAVGVGKCWDGCWEKCWDWVEFGMDIIRQGAENWAKLGINVPRGSEKI